MKLENIDGVYDLNGQVDNNLVDESGFEILDIKEAFEVPVKLYLISTRKT